MSKCSNYTHTHTPSSSGVWVFGRPVVGDWAQGSVRSVSAFAATLGVPPTLNLARHSEGKDLTTLMRKKIQAIDLCDLWIFQEKSF